MKIKCPFSIKNCITTIIVCLFLIRGLQLYMKMHKSDLRVETVGLISQQPFEGDTTAMYLRKIESRFKMENFELIQMMNETNPNIISDDAMLVISASHTSVESTYAHLIQKIQRSSDANSSLPFYLLRKAKSLLMQNSKSINEEISEIVQVFQYFTNSLMIKRLTILSFEEGSLLCLRALVYIKYDVFSIIDKVILINAFNPTLVILHSNAASFLRETKQKILADPIRTQLTNGTRIIIIHTVDNNLGDCSELNWIFKNSEGELVTFANSIVVQSKNMWNVYSFLKPEEYFRFEPFLYILTRFFNEDRSSAPLTVRQINFLLLYRELPTPNKILTIEKRNKYLARCQDFHMENYNQGGNSFNVECIRILRKQDFYFNEYTSMIIKGNGKFQIFGESYEKLAAYEAHEESTVYLLENIMDYRRIFVINTRRCNVNIRIMAALHPLILKSAWTEIIIPEPELPTFQSSRAYYSSPPASLSLLSPVRLCPGQTYLYPTHYLPLTFLAQSSSSSSAYPLLPQFWLHQQQSNCFLAVDSYQILLYNINKYWSLGFNLIVFSLFCMHVVKISTFSRFYYQLLVNYGLCFVHTGQSLLAENVLVLAIVVVLELVLRLATFMSDMIYMPKKLAIKVMWVPLAFQILRWFKANIFFSPWKAIGLIFFAGTRKSNIIILFLKFSFIMEYILRDISNPEGLFLCCSWLALSSLEQPTQEKKSQTSNSQNSSNSTTTSNNASTSITQSATSVANFFMQTRGRRLVTIRLTILNLRKQITDTITVCIMAVCLSQDGMVFHYIINFYIIAYMIFAVHQQVNDLI